MSDAQIRHEYRNGIVFELLPDFARVIHAVSCLVTVPCSAHSSEKSNA